MYLNSAMRRVLHLKMVTQCAMLEDFGIFLVLADKVRMHLVTASRHLICLKSLFAYHIEALVPSSPQSVNASQTPQKLNGNRDVQFFSVGQLNGRTLVCYMKKKGVRVLQLELQLAADASSDRERVPPPRACDRQNQRTSEGSCRIIVSLWLPLAEDGLVPKLS